MKDEYDFSNGRRGAVLKVPPGKSRVTIRLDNDVLEWFRAKVNEAGGGNYQTLINAALRDHVASNAPELEAMMRKVVREELARTQAGAKER